MVSEDMTGYNIERGECSQDDDLEEADTDDSLWNQVKVKFRVNSLDDLPEDALQSLLALDYRKDPLR
jgi:hypothetical protein